MIEDPNNKEPVSTRDEPISILIVNQSFWPDVVATAQQAHDLATALVARGDRVTCLSSRSLYGRAGSTLPRHEFKGGVEIHRVSSNLFSKRGLLTRTFDYLRFNVSCTIKAALLPRHDVVICLTTPPFVALVGVILRALKGSKFVLWSMDLYPDLPVAAGILKRNGPLHRILARLDRLALHSADCVVVLGRCMRARVLEKGVNPKALRMIHPWSDPNEILSIPARVPGQVIDETPVTTTGVSSQPIQCRPNRYREAWGIGDRYVIQYSGNFGLGHDAQTVFDCMRALKDVDDIRWVMVGDGVMKPMLVDFVHRNSITNVIIRPYQPRKDLSALMSLGDMHLVLMAPGFDGVILPSKLYGILAAARPAVFVGPHESEIARVIEEESCGIVVKNGDTLHLQAVIKMLREDPGLGLKFGQQGRHALETKYSMQHACESWYRLLHDLTGDTTLRPHRSEAS